MSNTKTLDQLIHKDYLDKDGEKVKIDVSPDNYPLFVPYRIIKKLFGKIDGIKIQSILPQYITIKFDQTLRQVWIKDKFLNIVAKDKFLNIVGKGQMTDFLFNEFLVVVSCIQKSIILMHTKYPYYWKVNLNNLANNLKKVYVNLKPWGTKEKWEKFVYLKDEIYINFMKNEFRPKMYKQLKEKHGGKIPTKALKDLKALERAITLQKHRFLSTGTTEEQAHQFVQLTFKLGPKIFDVLKPRI